jgi:hypothetical protein
LLATPFVLLGNSAYQSLFGLPAFFLTAASALTGPKPALLLLWVLLVLCPSVVHQLVTGGNSITSGIAPLVFCWWLKERASTRASRTMAAAGLGLAVATRLNFVLLVPLAVVALVRRRGLSRAVEDGVVLALVFLAVTLPFYLFDPAGFMPLEGMSRATRFDTVLPAGGSLYIAGGVMVTALAAWRVRSFEAGAALVQGFFVIAGIAFLSLGSNRLRLDYGGYGLFFAFFGAFACWQYLVTHTVQVPHARARAAVLPPAPGDVPHDQTVPFRYAVTRDDE